MLQRDKVTRSCRAQRDARHQPLQVLDGPDRIAELAAIRRPESELLHGVEPIADPIERQERAQQPRAQGPAADGGDCPVELREQRSVASAFRAFQDFEVLERRRIDDQRVGALAVGQRADVREIDLLGRFQVMNQRASSGDGGRPPIEAEPFETAHAQLIEQRSPRRLDVECPAVDRRRRNAGRGDDRDRIRAGGGHDFAWLDHRELVGERLEAVDAVVLGGRELTGRGVEQRDADAAFAIGGRRGRDGHQERRLARVEVAGVGQGSGRYDADDLALDDPLGLARILHLIADRDAKSLSDEAGDVAVDRVKGDAAHRNPAAVGGLRPGGQRQLEGARGDEGVFVEHLVEVAHPEEEDRIAMLLLRVEILPHRRRRRR